MDTFPAEPNTATANTEQNELGAQVSRTVNTPIPIMTPVEPAQKLSHYLAHSPFFSGF